MTDVLHIDLRFLVQLALCSALLTCIALTAFRRNAVTRRAYALLAGGLLIALPLVLAVSSGWYWTAPFDSLAALSLAGAVPVPLWLLVAWFGVAVTLNIRAVAQARGSRGRLRALPEIDDVNVQREAATVARALGFPRTYRLHLGDDAFSSSLAGDRIVLPTDAMTWRTGTLRAVLAHEFVHLSRRDDLAVLGLSVVLHWYWFAPWLGLLRRQFIEAMEQSCDDRAAECLPSCAHYLDGVLCAVRDEPEPPAVVARLSGSAVVTRFQRFLGIREHQLDVGRVYWGLVTVLGAALLLTSVEFEASEPASAWSSTPANARRVVLGPPELRLPEVRERALAGGDLRPREARQPIYPGQALADAIEGYVVVEYRLTGDGRVVRPSVIASEPAGVFEDVVLRAVGRREYAHAAPPAIALSSGPTPARHLIRRFDFVLPDSAPSEGEQY